MSRCLIESFPYLLVLSEARSSELIKLLIKESDNCLLEALTEIFANVLENPFLLTPTARKLLKNSSRIIDLLGKKKKNLEQKRSQFIKYGPRFIPLILPSILKEIYGS